MRLAPALFLAASLAAVPALAEERPTGGQALVDWREQNLKDVADAMKALPTLAASPDTKPAALEAAQLIADTGRDMPGWFPEGSGPGGEGITKTRALPAIWERKAEFDGHAKKMEEAGLALVAAVEAGDAAQVGELMKAAGGSCKACHTDFRAKEE